MEQTVFVCALVVFLVSSHAVLTHYTVESNTFSSTRDFFDHPILSGYILACDRNDERIKFNF